MRTELVADALGMAVARRRPEPGLIHHSDQRSQYVALGFGQQARDAGIAVSMDRRATPTTTPSPRASSPQSRRSSCIASHGRADAICPRPSSMTSRRSTTARDDTQRSDTSPQRNTRTPNSQRQRKPSDEARNRPPNGCHSTFLRLLAERRNGHVQADRDLGDRVEANVELAALDRAVVGALKAGVTCECLLAVAVLFTS